uniref:Uncharacterized protein n=1 Tax=Heterorhabditis bacteriophora TaxID=37862 RepID=A0A1I7XP96_HETBA
MNATHISVLFIFFLILYQSSGQYYYEGFGYPYGYGFDGIYGLGFDYPYYGGYGIFKKREAGLKPMHSKEYPKLINNDT